MQSAQAVERRSFPATTMAMFAALLITFVLGGIGGYAVKALDTTSAGTVHAAVCPAGAHAVVWYTAQTWTCETKP